ncbi:alpha/beta hydrolase [Actinoplanes sp. NPDC049668]|uniref:alpha/beta hydrolase n=1 Tax=unclassified Actinoplanes TaxID=2626549 RepID=UPI0033B76C98
MTETYWPHPSLSDRVAGDPGRVALLIPGNEYSAARPLLHFARAVLMRHGWTTQEVWWPERTPQREGDDLEPWFDRLRDFACAHVSRMIDAETAPRILLVGKSLGTLTAPLAADRGLPAVWLTPLLRDAKTVDALRRGAAPYLLAGGAADPAWDAAVARSLGRPFYEAPDADHGMETDDDPANSAEILRRATVAMDEFVATLT